MSNFKTDVERGKLGEEVAEGIFSWGDWKTVKRYDDVRDLTHYQEQDIDYICYVEENGKLMQYGVEVKTEPAAENTGNFFIEKEIYYFAGRKRGTTARGWFFITKADYMFFYVPAKKSKMGTMYIVAFNELKEFIKKKNPRTATHKSNYNIVTGYLVNIESLCKFCNVQKVEGY